MPRESLPSALNSRQRDARCFSIRCCRRFLGVRKIFEHWSGGRKHANCGISLSLLNQHSQSSRRAPVARAQWGHESRCDADVSSVLHEKEAHQVQQTLIWKRFTALSPALPTGSRSAVSCAPGKLLWHHHGLPLTDTPRLVTNGDMTYPTVERRLMSFKLIESRECLCSVRLRARRRKDTQVCAFGFWCTMVFGGWLSTW